MTTFTTLEKYSFITIQKYEWFYNRRLLQGKPSKQRASLDAMARSYMYMNGSITLEKTEQLTTETMPLAPKPYYWHTMTTNEIGSLLQFPHFKENISNKLIKSSCEALKLLHARTN